MNPLPLQSLAKMRLEPFATEADVDEALRLFQVSTLDAAMSGSLTGEEGEGREVKKGCGRREKK